jgi:hypothetical protein
VISPVSGQHAWLDRVDEVKRDLATYQRQIIDALGCHSFTVTYLLPAKRVMVVACRKRRPAIRRHPETAVGQEPRDDPR